MKFTTKKKPMVAEHAPGELMSTHIEYGAGKHGGASVTHHHKPMMTKSKANDPWGPSPSSGTQHFSSKHEAIQNAAQAAGVDASMEDSPAEEAGENG